MKPKKQKRKRPKRSPVVWVEGEKLDEKTGKMVSFRYKLKV
jgi:hypothetical protein